MLYDLIIQVVTIALVVYFGLHLWSQLRTLKSTVEAQKATIDAQAEQMKAQSTVLQDFERLNKMMKELIDTVDAPAMLQRMQSYKALVDEQAVMLLKEQARQLTEQHQARLEHMGMVAAEVSGKILGKQVVQFIILMAKAMPFIPPAKRTALIETADIFPDSKQYLQKFAELAPYQPIEAPANGLSAVGLYWYQHVLSRNAKPFSQEDHEP